MIKKITIFCVVCSFIFTPTPGLSQDTLELVKAPSSPTVYYIDRNNIRHPFPDATTYSSWYGTNFGLIRSVSDAYIARYPMGATMTIRPGTYLVKITTAPEVYVVETGAVLRQIQDEALANRMFGDNWQKRVVDVPDVFFDDYTIGEPLTTDRILPDGTVFYEKITDTYYFKDKGAARPFANREAVTQNRFSLAHVINGTNRYTTRVRPITGFDSSVFNPVVQARLDTRDCENELLKIATIFVVSGAHTPAQVKKIEQFKAGISDRYYWATESLSQLDMSYPTVILQDDGYLLDRNTDGTARILPEVTHTFFDQHPDAFDFVFVWTNVKVPFEDEDVNAQYIPVTNGWRGNGNTEFNRADQYGSTGKLKGIIHMGDINRYTTTDGALYSQALDTALHEIGHHWLAFLGFSDAENKFSRALLDDASNHWSRFVNFASPMGPWGWVDNGDGTVTSKRGLMTDPYLRKYSILDLYLMGLIPHQVMPSISYVVPESKDAQGGIISGTLAEVSMQQIIRANGRMRCMLSQ